MIKRTEIPEMVAARKSIIEAPDLTPLDKITYILFSNTINDENISSLSALEISSILGITHLTACHATKRLADFGYIQRFGASKTKKTRVLK